MTAVEVGSPEWSRRVTASKAAAILGLSPWESPYSLWMQMAGRDERPQTDQMRRGTYLESGILAWWRDQHPDLTDYREQVWHEHGDWAGATPDVDAVEGGDHIIADAKSAARMDEWGDPGTDEIPDYYLASTYFQLAVTGARRCHIAVLGTYLEFAEYVVEADEAYQRDILAVCRRFHGSLTSDEPPELDDHKATYNTVRRLNPTLEKGSTVEVGEVGLSWLEAKANAEHWADVERGLKSRLLDLQGKAQYATAGGIPVARRQASGKGIALYAVKPPQNEEKSA